MYPSLGEKGLLRFGYGWGVEESRFGTGFYADGTGGTFYARIGILPASGHALVGLANSGNAEPAMTDIVGIVARATR